MKSKAFSLPKPSFLGFCLVSILLFWVVHIWTDRFWITLPVVSAVLTLLSLRQTKIKLTLCHTSAYFWAILSGVALYLLFWIGNQFGSQLFPLSFPSEVSGLYQTLQPKNVLSWTLLFVLIIPAEEIIWRSVILEKLLEKITAPYAMISAVAIYTCSLLFAASPLLILAGLFGGLLWSWLYTWKRSLILPLLSHFTFDILLLLAFPL